MGERDVNKCKSTDYLVKIEIPNQLNRIERMLKFLCIRARVMDFKDIDDASAMPLHGKALTRLRKLLKASPNISDILDDVEKK